LDNQAYSCISCDSYRMLDHGSCYCIVGYYDIDVEQCGVCNIKLCIACSSATVCVNCALSAVMDSSSQCICPVGQF
jgi:hypothetical protein